MSVDCFIMAFFVHTVPLPDSPAWSREFFVAPTCSAVRTVYTAEILLKYQSFRLVPSILCNKCTCITFAITFLFDAQIYQIIII